MASADPGSVLAWAKPLGAEGAKRVQNLVRQELRARGLEAILDDRGARWVGPHGAPIRVPLDDLAELCGRTPPSEWSALTSERLDALLSGDRFETPTLDEEAPPSGAPDARTAHSGDPAAVPAALEPPRRRAEPLVDTKLPVPIPPSSPASPPGPLPPAMPPPATPPPLGGYPPGPPPHPSGYRPPPGRRPMGARPRGGKRSARRPTIVTIGLVTGVALSFSLDAFQAWETVRKPDPEPALSARNDVLLEASPIGEVRVFAADDGRPLGRAPLRFLVPEGPPIYVLLTAPGRTPTRVKLPPSGRVKAHLDPRLPTAETCTLRVRTSPGWTLNMLDEGVLDDDAGTVTFAQATVVRAEPLDYGAFLLACPTDEDDEPKEDEPPLYLGKRMRNGPVSLAVSSPRGALVTLGSDPIGNVPASWSQGPAFAKVSVSATGKENIWRWVAAPFSLKVKMPSGRFEPKTELPGSDVPELRLDPRFSEPDDPDTPPAPAR